MRHGLTPTTYGLLYFGAISGLVAHAGHQRRGAQTQHATLPHGQLATEITGHFQEGCFHVNYLP